MTTSEFHVSTTWRTQIVSITSKIATIIADNNWKDEVIISSGSQEVSFKSEPEGALIVIGGREMGRTPMTSKIDRKSGQVVSFRLDGYKTQEMPLASTVNGWFFE